MRITVSWTYRERLSNSIADRFDVIVTLSDESVVTVPVSHTPAKQTYRVTLGPYVEGLATVKVLSVKPEQAQGNVPSRPVVTDGTSPAQVGLVMTVVSGGPP